MNIKKKVISGISCFMAGWMLFLGTVSVDAFAVKEELKVKTFLKKHRKIVKNGLTFGVAGAGVALCAILGILAKMRNDKLEDLSLPLNDKPEGNVSHDESINLPSKRVLSREEEEKIANKFREAMEAERICRKKIMFEVLKFLVFASLREYYKESGKGEYNLDTFENEKCVTADENYDYMNISLKDWGSNVRKQLKYLPARSRNMLNCFAGSFGYTPSQNDYDVKYPISGWRFTDSDTFDDSNVYAVWVYFVEDSDVFLKKIPEFAEYMELLDALKEQSRDLIITYRLLMWNGAWPENPTLI